MSQEPEASNDPALADETPVTLDALMVTAQKRIENAQNVPLSVQSLTQRDIDRKAVDNLFTLQQTIPGLDVNSIAQFTTIYLRGLGTDAFLMADPSVAYYVDGIYFPFSQSLDQKFGAVDRVEVLKGPQGTLFGRNAIGGAISVHTRNPDPEAWELSLDAGGASRDTHQYRAHINIPLADWFAVSVSGYDDRGDHYMRGTAAGEPLREEVSRGGRAKLRWLPTDDLDITLAGLHLIQQGSGSVFQLNSDPSPLFRCSDTNQTPFCIEPQTGYEGALSEPTFLDFESTAGYGNLDWRLPWFGIKLLGSHQKADSVFSYDFDGSPQSLAAFDQKRNFAVVDTAELQFLSHDGSWNASRFEWIAGGYYFKSEQGFDPAALQPGGLDLADQHAGGFSLPAPLRTALDALSVNYPNGDIAFHALIGTRSTSGFFQGTLKLTEWLSLTGGGRYQKEERYIIRSDSGSFNSDGSFTTLFDWQNARDEDGNAVPTRDVTTGFKPKGTIELRPLDDVLLYATYQEAQKSSTYNTVALYQPPAYVRPEELRAVEVGAKTSWFDDVLQLNAAAFRYEITDLQVQFISLLQGGAVSFENAGAATIQGIDAETRLRIFPQWLDRFTLRLAGTWLDGIYDDYTDASGFDPETGLFSSDNDYTGNRTVRTPRFSGTAELSKVWYLDSGELEIGGDAYRNSGFFYAASNDPRFDQEEYTLYGARLSYLYRPWGLRLSAYGRNLSNVLYSQGLIATDFGTNYTLAPPRTVGVRLSLDL